MSAIGSTQAPQPAVAATAKKAWIKKAVAKKITPAPALPSGQQT
jgi:hypothetical protein